MNSYSHSNFYAHQDANITQQRGRLLAYQHGKTFVPEKILDTWLEHGPAGQSRTELHRAITHKAAQIVVVESAKACRKDELKLSSQAVRSTDLTFTATPGKLAETYCALMPCL